MSNGGDELQAGAVPEHALLCFETIGAKLGATTSLPVPGFDGNEEYPLFVTWNLRSRSTGQPRLRGCIGNFEPMPLGEGLRDYAVISAFKDHRFSPISAKELPRLEVDVSLLTTFELCDTIYDWDIDTHGIHITFPNPALTPSFLSSSPPSSVSSIQNSPLPSATTSTSSLSSTTTSRPSFRSISHLPRFVPPTYPNPKGLHRSLSATYLPGVIEEQGWTKVEALDSLIRKAGWSGRVSDPLRASLRVARYQSKKVGISYEEWMQWRDTQ